MRNYRTYDSFVFVSSNGGLNLLLGNSDATPPNAGSTVDVSAYAPASEDLNEVELDRHYAREAGAYMRERPVQVLGMYLLKFLNYFNYKNTMATTAETSRWREWIMLLTYWPLLVVGGARLLLRRKFPLSYFEQCACLLYVVNGAFAAIFFTRIRYRVPFDMLLIALAAAILAKILFTRASTKSSI